MSLPFLLEIGTEEIPDWMIPGALENLRLLFAEAGEVPAASRSRCDATPRRLVLRAEGLPERQPDSEELRAWVRRNRRRQGGRGLRARSRASPVEPTHVQSDGEGRVLRFHARKSRAAPRSDILAEALPALILQIYFPKTMYWTGKGGPRFIRPIRWIVALLGEEIVPVRTGRRALGRR